LRNILHSNRFVKTVLPHGCFWYAFPYNYSKKTGKAGLLITLFLDATFMKSNEQARAFFNAVPQSAGHTKPAAPFTARQAFEGRRAPDPSSVLRSDRYPIPTSFEYRMRTGE
jgi:hypothetical protein